MSKGGCYKRVFAENCIFYRKNIYQPVFLKGCLFDTPLSGMGGLITRPFKKIMCVDNT